MNTEKKLKKTEPPGRTALNENESKQLLKHYGIPVVDERVAPGGDDAIEAARALGFPVVLKGMGATLMHKTERGLVRLNLRDADAVREAASAIADAAGDELEGFLVQPQITANRELVAGLFRDDLFGPVIMFGIGGIFTEAFSDVAFRLAPLDLSDADDMLSEIRAKALFGPFRGEEAADRDRLRAVLMALSRIAVERPEIAEIDINPLMLTPAGEIIAADALVVRQDAPPVRQYPRPVDPVLLGKFFHPRSVAFVGASGQMGKWGHILPAITIAQKFGGEIYMVNPKGGTIMGRPVCTSLDEIPGPVDLAVVTIPAAGIMDLIPKLAEKGIRNMLLISSGFAETGEAGRKLEKALAEKAWEAGVLVLGPNTMGVCNPHIRLYCTGSHVWPDPGDTAVVAQSGNMGTQLLAFAEKQGVGIRCFAGSGNEAMITIEDYLEGFEADRRTRNVMLYVESVKNGRRFFEVARRVGRKKPIVLMKGGRTRSGNRAAASHTGALSSDVKIFDAMCRQAGIVQVSYSTDLLDLSAAFSSLPLPRGNRAAIMTLGGGWGVVTADLCDEYGLRVPDLSQEITEHIDRILPPYWSRSNPVDVVGEHDDAVAITVMEELMAWDGCDAVINLGMIGRKILMGRLAQSVQAADPSCSPAFLETMQQTLAGFEQKYIAYIAELMEKYDKPVFGVSLFEDAGQTVCKVPDRKFNGVFYPTPERAVKVFSKMCEYRSFLNRRV
ncbi:CoA-binding protein [Desulfonema ishimotonii]|uniref:CoA-binding protein n=1 Tax=Desulfonema ishimotonii TaxID=45657 RepID=A0A401FXB9_9BACT|nr:acetate--CoA ligase family protein [Desulfonema ishimotonii]GBC61596.1 CoA-binding protein [Desulfonema ishimotonii]